MDAPSPLVKHLKEKLRGDGYNYAEREGALVDVIALATCPGTCTMSFLSVPMDDRKKIFTFADEAGTGYEVDLNALIPDLLEAYRSGPADGHRLLALSALINIGNEEALEQLLEEGTRQPEGTNRATQRSLAAFYLEKYPELRNRAMRSGQIALTDVRRVSALRAKRAEKAKSQQ